MIKFIYTIFLAILVALFVGLGIDAFYPGPKAPQYPYELNQPKEGCELSAEQQAINNDFNIAQQRYNEEFKPYSRNVSMIVLAAAILILIVSLTMMNRIKMIADGMLLGGVFTTLYGIVRGMMSDSSQFRFVIVTIGLVIALVLGYIKFIRHKETPPQAEL